jgi:murein DD-endopeptidase MepM/ murein hydrolase activator NlpD
MLRHDEPPAPSRGGASTSPPGCTVAPCGGASARSRPPASSDSPAPDPTGSLEVTVRRLAVCWDTGPDWENSEDPALEGCIVSISGPGGPLTAKTDGNGKFLFEGLAVGDYSVTASMTEPVPGGSAGTGKAWDDVTASTDQLAAAATTVVADSTAHARRTMRRPGLECNRKHLPRPGPQGDGGASIWLPIFWIPWSEPFWILFLLRDLVAWGGSGAGIALGAAFGNLSLVAFAGAFFGYISNVIFGMAVGVTLMVAASIVYLLVVAMALLPSFIPGTGADPWFFPMASATWAGFLFAVARGRTGAYSNLDWVVPIVSAMVGLLTAGLVVILMGSPVLVGIGAISLGAVAAFVAGLLGHTFVNEGRVQAAAWGSADFQLPYDGERYCVQGMHGWISHHGWQEFAYDWAMPEGRQILCAKEGHITGFREDRSGTQAFSGNPTANHVTVRHREGSEAAYLHLMQGGITALNPALGPLGSQLSVDPVHVHAGQRLGKAGNVGISMFPHLHFAVKHAPSQPGNAGEAEAGLPVKFADGDVARHGGVCYSMRKYQSSNVDRGPVRVPSAAAGAPLPAGESLASGVAPLPELITPASALPLDLPTPFPAAGRDASLSPKSVHV